MEVSTIIIISILVVANGVLAYSEYRRRQDFAQSIDCLKKRKLAQGVKEDKLDEDDLKDEVEPKQRYSWIFGIVICLDIWILGAVGTHLWASKFFVDVPAGDSRKALFGDSFGAVNALVSAFAFAGMIVAFILQRYELRLQRKELRDNRDEMERQTTQFKDQNENLEIQRFENLFYNMLNLQQKIVDGLRYDYYEVEYVTVPFTEGGATTDKKKVKREIVGRDVFRFLFREVEFNAEIDGVVNTIQGYSHYLRISGIENYDGTLIPSYFDHYFRHLYKIVQFVDSQSFEFAVKYRYLSFLRGTLSRYELVWLYYNALCPDFYKFKDLIESYSLLKALRRDLLTLSKETVGYYNGLGVVDEDLRSRNFGIDDFAFFLTDNKDDKSKYYISAFWKKDDMQYGLEYLSNWRAFIDEKAGQTIQEFR